MRNPAVIDAFHARDDADPDRGQGADLDWQLDIRQCDRRNRIAFITGYRADHETEILVFIARTDVDGSMRFTVVISAYDAVKIAGAADEHAGIEIIVSGLFMVGAQMDTHLECGRIGSGLPGIADMTDGQQRGG